MTTAQRAARIENSAMQSAAARRAIGRLLAPRPQMLTPQARAAIVAALVQSQIRAQDIQFQQGPDSVLLIFDPLRRRDYPRSSAIAAIKAQSYVLVGARDLDDGREVVEFSTRRLGHMGIGELCHVNAAMPASMLATRGWIVADRPAKPAILN